MSPTCVGLPGKRGAGGNDGSLRTQRGARSLRGGRSTLIHNPGGTPGVTLGDPDRSGLRCLGCVFRKWGRGPCAFPRRR